MPVGNRLKACAPMHNFLCASKSESLSIQFKINRQIVKEQVPMPMPYDMSGIGASLKKLPKGQHALMGANSAISGCAIFTTVCCDIFPFRKLPPSRFYPCELSGALECPSYILGWSSQSIYSKRPANCLGIRPVERSVQVFCRSRSRCYPIDLPMSITIPNKCR